MNSTILFGKAQKQCVEEARSGEQDQNVQFTEFFSLAGQSFYSQFR